MSAWTRPNALCVRGFDRAHPSLYAHRVQARVRYFSSLSQWISCFHELAIGNTKMGGNSEILRMLWKRCTP
eukprot:1332588-Rhodomonas_salina.1